MQTESIIAYKKKDPIDENSDYLNKQIITYLGNKRGLLNFVNKGLTIVKRRLSKRKLNIFDVFSGSGIVSRFFKQHAKKLIVNDLEKYSEVINRCYLSNKSEINLNYLEQLYYDITFKLNNEPLFKGLIANLYAPQNDNKIKKGERVFYTSRNAMYLDTARHYIESVPTEFKNYLLAPLLSEASIHANTSGVFKGFYKNAESGIGKFGGSKGDALLRILGSIELPFPIFSNFSCQTEIYRGDSNQIAKTISEVDLAYIDPPYNQHPYGSNYFMLNLLIDYCEPKEISEISGIPIDWNRSDYNKKSNSIIAFTNLMTSLKAKYLLISFNSEGFISQKEMINILKKMGNVEVLETKYNTFRGSRNLRNRTIHIKEFLYLLEKR